MQVKFWEGMGSKDTSLFLTLTVLKGVSAFAQSVGWVPGPWSSRDLVLLVSCKEHGDLQGARGSGLQC